MGSITARALWITSPGQAEIRSETVRDAGAGELRIRTLFSAISRGTESLVFRGRVPPSEYARMRAPFQSGELPGPVKYGYSNVGVVDQGPNRWIGRHVFCLFPHQTHFLVPLASAHPLPAAVPPGRAVLAANLETALNGLWDAALAPGARLTVIGAGTVGCLLAWLAAKTAAADVELIDIDPARAAVAAALGVGFALPDAATPGAATIVHASGSADGLRLALTLAGFEATIIEMSWFGAQPVSLPLGESFHSQRLTLRSSQVGTVAAPQRHRYDTAARLAYSIELLDDPALDALISGEDPFEELPLVLHRLGTSGENAMCHRIIYS